MNHCVLDWSVQVEDSRHGLPPSANHSKSMWREDDVVELLWQNGHVVMQSQTERKAMNSPCEVMRRCQKPESAVKGGPLKSAGNVAAAAAPWPLQYTIDDDDDDCFDGELYQEFLCDLPAMAGSTPAVAAEGNEAAERATPERDATFSGSVLEQADVTPFAETAVPYRSGFVASSTAAMESSISGSGHLHNFFRRSCANNGHPSSLGDEITIASSSGGSGCTVGRAGQQGANARSHKRKGRDTDESELQSEEAGYESVETSRQSQRSVSDRRRRAAEVHNLSERRRRDRINEKMKALQELIPHCNKSDKASMLDEAIEYLKSLQLQVQIMWMRSGLAPMAFPGIHHHSMLQMGMGMVHASMPPPIHAPIPCPRMPLLNQLVSSSPTVNHAPICPPSNPPPNFPNQMQAPHFPMLYAHCLGFQHMQTPPQMMNLFAYGGSNLMQQNQAALGAGSSTPSPGEDGNAG